jgi:murein DD-endopeptidase MepM/ murein hydrolase activator NlpD
MNLFSLVFAKIRPIKGYHFAIIMVVVIVTILNLRLSPANVEEPTKLKSMSLTLPQPSIQERLQDDSQQTSQTHLPADDKSQPTAHQIRPPQTDQTPWMTTSVKQGDSLAVIFSRLNLTNKDLYALISSCSEGEALAKLKPGQTFRIRTDRNGKLLELVYEQNKLTQMRFIRTGDTFKPEPIELAQWAEKRIVFRSGTITHSFYHTALQTGMPQPLIMELVDIFRWDIDFALNIRSGDSFIVAYEELYLKGEKIGDGHILAAEFNNADENYRAVRYRNSQGEAHYYTPDGRSLRQTFLRAPVDFRRISSHFQKERLHPILGVKRPHKGVDYAAATGTPILAAGDGTVEFIGTKGGYGKTIVLKHDERYTTLYGHMSKFQKNLSQGSQVSQGDVIGYVGMTGMSTGPHLHYEFRIDGEHVDPVKVKLPRPTLVAATEDFRRQTAPLLAQLDTYRRTRLAMLNEL